MTHSDLEVALLHALKVKVVGEVRSRNLKDGISIEELRTVILYSAKSLSLVMGDELLNQAVLMVRSEIDVTGRGADVLDADPHLSLIHI